MSFLGDLVDSIGTNRPPVLPKPIPKPPIISSAAHSIPAPRPKTVPDIPTPPVAGLKRKLDERDAKPSKPPERVVKPNPVPVQSNKVIPKPTNTPNGVRPPIPKAPMNSANSNSSAPAKPATKGSYADMMARAKEAQQSRTPNPVGTIKHQATSKEKISKLAERRRQEQEKLKTDKDKKTGKSINTEKVGVTGKIDKKRGVSPTKKNDQVKVPRAPRPPLHAPASSSYKGTMGTNAKRPRDERVAKKSRYDEYLATDEEDNSDVDDYGDDDEGGYGSEGSSDMEAGLDDIDMEENAALRAAKEDDAREIAYENELKREKEERKRRLQAMANKRR